jgi:hypothetical protein
VLVLSPPRRLPQNGRAGLAGRARRRPIEQRCGLFAHFKNNYPHAKRTVTGGLVAGDNYIHPR